MALTSSTDALLQDERFMQAALAEADLAERRGEVPVGCVLVRDGVVISRGHNLRETSQDPSSHAELSGLRAAAARLGTWRLTGVTVYVTLEPCVMCAGALVHSRVDRVVYGCHDPKAGAVTSLYNIGVDGKLNHRFELTSGVMGDTCSERLSAFFRRIRSESRALPNR
jgi:tRNA(adenine34) deaminase